MILSKSLSLVCFVVGFALIESKFRIRFRTGGVSRSASRSASSSWSSRSSSRSLSSRGLTSGGSSYGYPKQQWSWSRSRNYGSSSIGSSSYKTHGYGTKFGTSFPGGVGQFRSEWKSVGLGVRRGYVDIAPGSSSAVLGVWHRYMQYKMLTSSLGIHYNRDYYYNTCEGGCPGLSRCKFGFCEGRLKTPTVLDYSRRWSCDHHEDCKEIDINMLCDKNQNETFWDMDSVSQKKGICKCRQNLVWNNFTCQLDIDVDCSNITYDTQPSTVVLEAANKTLQKLESSKISSSWKSWTHSYDKEGSGNSPDNDDTEEDENEDKGVYVINENLSNSLLTSIDPNEASKEEVKEAFCRDVDTFSFELDNHEETQSSHYDSELQDLLLDLDWNTFETTTYKWKYEPDKSYETTTYANHHTGTIHPLWIIILIIKLFLGTMCYIAVVVYRWTKSHDDNQDQESNVQEYFEICRK